MRALVLLLLAGCATSPTSPPRTFVHPESAKDVRLIEALDAAPKEKEPPTVVDYLWKTPLVVPTLAILWAKDTPRALAEFAMTPVYLVEAVLVELGVLKPERELPPPPERDR